jgi:hypothetical protein
MRSSKEKGTWKQHTAVVRPLGFEPRTNGLRVHCSAIELEAHAGGSVGDRMPTPHAAAPIGVSEGT